MSKMKELAYTVERLEGLLQYLELLYKINDFDRISAVCDEIEKEFGYTSPKMNVGVGIADVGRYTSELVDDITKAFAKLGKTSLL